MMCIYKSEQSRKDFVCGSQGLNMELLAGAQDWEGGSTQTFFLVPKKQN